MIRPLSLLMAFCLIAGAASPSAPMLQALIEGEAFSMPAEMLLRLGQSLPTDSAYDVIELAEDNRFLFDAAGRVTVIHRYVFRVDRAAALPGWGRVQASWLPWLNSRPTIRARVITPDGLEHHLDPSTIGDAQEQDETHEMFEDRRLVRAPLPMLKEGAVAEVEILVREHRPFATSGFRRTLPLIWGVPVHRSRLLVEAPSGVSVNYRVFGLPEGALTREKVKATQRFRVEQGLSLPPKPREPFQGFDEEPFPSLLLTTTVSWADVVAEYRAIIEPKTGAADFKAWARETIGEAKTRNLKIQRILSRLQKQIRYVGLEFGESAIVPRTPEETLRRGYGDCKDQSTLLVTMLREAGIEAHVALLRAGETRDFSPEFPGLAAFNHAIVFIPGKDPLWVDPTVPQARVGQIPLASAGRNALVIAPGVKGIIKIPTTTVGENCEIETREVFLANDGPGRVLEKTDSKGVAEVAQRIRFTSADPTRLRENLKEYVKNTYRAEALGELTLSNPLDLDQPFRLQVEAKKASSAYTSVKDARVALNPWPLVTALNQYLQPGERDPRDSRPDGETKVETPPRRTHLELPHPWSGELNWIIHAPEGYEIEALPQSQARAFGPATLRTDWRRGSKGTVEASFRFECDRLRWTPREVDEARAALKAFGEAPSPVIVFQNLGEAHLEAGRLKEAMAEFRRLSVRMPTAPGPLVRLAQTQMSVGLVESSRRTLEHAIALDPGAEHPHRQLGWTLQHDAMGRRFMGGWNRAGAAAELRKSVELAPELRMARLDLAILLGHNERGDWWASQDMDTVIQLYRDQLARGKDEAAQEQLTIALARTGKFSEARVSAQLLETAADRNGWTIALDALTKGADFAIQEAKRSIQDPEVRRKGIQGASDLLMTLRHYPEAGAVSRECIGGAEAATYQARARLAPRMKPYESVPVDLKTPVGAILALARATAEPGFDPDKAIALLSPAQRPEGRDEATLLKVMADFHYFRTSSREWRQQKLDELHSTVEFGIEGTDRTGFRIKVSGQNAILADLFVTCHDGIYQVVSWGYHSARLGKEALWEAERGDVIAARAWLDRAMGQIIMPTAQDPLSGHPAGHAWTTGRMGDLEEIRRAAALLILDSEPSEPARRIAEASLWTITDPSLRGALLRVLSLHNNPDRKAVDRYTTELLNLFPEKPRGPRFRAMFLAEDKRFDEALLVLQAGRKTNPSDESLLIYEASLFSRTGSPGKARELLLQAVREGKESTTILNNLAWNDLCLGQVTEQTADWAERAVQLSKKKGDYHTLACVQAELGRYTPARAALLESVPREVPIGPVTWFGLGLIAKSLGDLESARTYFGRVDTPENMEDPENPQTCKAMARKHLQAMETGRH